AAVSVPLDRGGVGWLVTALAGTAALLGIRLLPARRTAADRLMPALTAQRRATDPARFAWATATVALLGVGTLRAAGWLVLLCLATAVVTGALAVAGGRSMREMTAATLFSLIAPFRALPWVSHALATLRRRTPNGNGTRVAATIATAVALLVVFGTLFASADETFARVLENAVPDVDVPVLVRWTFVFVVAGGILAGSAFLRAGPPSPSTKDPAVRKVSRFEWAFPLGLLVLLFALFVAVQLTVLFGGFEHVMQTDDLTFASYARSGFWQLLIVTGLTLLVLAGAARWAPRANRADRILIRAILGALAVLTLIIVASALHKMTVYADTYGLTRMRLVVGLCEAWLGVVFALIVAAGIKLRAAWLPRVAVGLGVLTLLALAAINPDGLIADRNVTRFEKTGRIDTAYLADLSADAVPALDRLNSIDPPKAGCILNSIEARLGDDPDDWRGWSYGRAHARELLAANPPVTSEVCVPSYRDYSGD
ncbi:DUF4173 domain-containing protein, partial [Actinoplanes sp. NPDC051633]|uniref:DUF4153 domain-containing protein n=1 Tax=Actinoplanes sp. NPDC051633 TaxID=3155670 RepID=UPI003426D0FF